MKFTQEDIFIKGVDQPTFFNESSRANFSPNHPIQTTFI